MGLFSRKTTITSPAMAESRRRLFLDDDPMRAQIFLAANAEAVWVETANDCIAKLAEVWDEVHLDHDLGGEQFVDHERTDCGMEVVRWLCLERRKHLKRTAFYVHSHNPHAATLMAVQLMNAGYRVELRPFGAPELPPVPEYDPDLPPEPGLFTRMIDALRDWLHRPRDHSKEYGYEGVDRADPNRPPVERLDLSWTQPGARLPRGKPRMEDLREPVEKIDLSWGRPQATPATPTPRLAEEPPPAPDSQIEPA